MSASYLYHFGIDEVEMPESLDQAWTHFFRAGATSHFIQMLWSIAVYFCLLKHILLSGL